MGLRVNYYLKKETMFIRLYGELDQETVKPFRDKLIDIIDKYDIKNLVFNLNDLEFMDSTGIGLIIGRYNQLKLKGGKVILCSINKNLERIILLSGLPRICLIKENEQEVQLYLEETYG
jgi:stage II sporulation protein AA (anti-sigma F factor antagonist)